METKDGYKEVFPEEDLESTLSVLESFRKKLDEGDKASPLTVAEAALRQAKEKFHNLKEVLLQLDKKDFGLCLKCKQSIPIGRILFMPQSRYCVNCAR